jgi:AraC family L-rhamnose operon transcriptional activator RhaR
MTDLVSTFAWATFAPTDCGAYVLRMDPQEAVRPHDHLFHEVALVTSGSATHVTAAGRATIGVGDLIVLRPQVWHAYVAPTPEFAVTNCLLSPTLLRQLLPLLATAGATFDLFWRSTGGARSQRSPLVIALDAEARAGIVGCLDALMWEQRSARAEWQAIATGMGLALLARVARAWATGRRPPAARQRLSRRAEAAVARTSAYLEAHLDGAPSLTALAQRAGMTPAHLSRCFAVRMGSGIVAFVHRLRAEEACRLLRLTDLSVTAIAQRLGYEELAYFSRRFRACTGTSPRAYRSAAVARTETRP